MKKVEKREKLQGKKLKKRSGFTLIEMVIVVTIIGILSGVVAIKYNNAQNIARKNADYASASTLATAAYLSMENGDGASVYKDIKKLKDNKYIDRVPKPQSENAKSFKIEEKGGEIIVKLVKEKGENGEVKDLEEILYPKQDKEEAKPSV